MYLDLKKIKRITKDIPFYNDYDWNNWEHIPVLEKSVVSQNLKSMLSDKKDVKLVLNRTSGSSGIVLTIPWLQNESLFAMKKIWDLRKKHGVNIGDQYITCHANYFLGQRLLQNKIIVSKNCHSISKLYMQESDIAHYVKYIQELQPTWMLLQPSVAYSIGHYIYNQKIDFPFLKLIELTGEFLTDNIYQSIKKYFGGVDICNNYGMQEFYCIGYAESSDTPFKLLEDNVYVEILDNDGNPVQKGKEGSIVVSGLINSYFPLIRYRTGDYGFLTEKDGELYLHLTQSRSNDAFIYNDKVYDASLFFNLTEYLNTKKCNIQQFQYSYFNNDLLCKFYSVGCNVSDTQIKTFISNYFTNHHRIVFDSISIEWSGEFTIPTGNNKIKYFNNMNLKKDGFEAIKATKN